MSYIVPIGPYHPALEEPIHAKLYTAVSYTHLTLPTKLEV